MTTAVEFLEDARDEYDEAFNWYADRSVSAAVGFASEIDAAVEVISRDPGRFVFTYGGCQLYRLKRYPYCVIYLVSDHKIIVIAIAHAKRSPGYWHRRI